ncbi:MAG: hypothetical protein Q9222_005051 [Ikaeria aurantiellina]
MINCDIVKISATHTIYRSDAKDQKSTASTRKSPKPEKKSSAKPIGVQRTPTKAKQPRVWRRTDIHFGPNTRARPYPTPSPTPSRKRDSESKMSVDEQLSQARDFLSSEDPYTNPGFSKRYMAIQTMMYNLASTKEMFDAQAYKDVRAMLRVHRERMEERDLIAAARLPPPAVTAPSRSIFSEPPRGIFADPSAPVFGDRSRSIYAVPSVPSFGEPSGSTFAVPSASSESASPESSRRTKVFTTDLPYSKGQTTPETVATSRHSQEEGPRDHPGTEIRGLGLEDEDEDPLLFQPELLGKPRLVEGFDPERGFVKRWIVGDKVIYEDLTNGPAKKGLDSGVTGKRKADQKVFPLAEDNSSNTKRGKFAEPKRPLEDIDYPDLSSNGIFRMPSASANKKPEKQPGKFTLPPVDDPDYDLYGVSTDEESALTHDSEEERHRERLRKSMEVIHRPGLSTSKAQKQKAANITEKTSVNEEHEGAQPPSEIPGVFWPGDPFFMFGETKYLEALMSRQIEIDLANGKHFPNHPSINGSRTCLLQRLRTDVLLAM